MPCILTELNISQLTPTSAPLIYTNIVLYHFYTFWHYLCHPQGVPHQDLKLAKI